MFKTFSKVFHSVKSLTVSMCRFDEYAEISNNPYILGMGLSCKIFLHVQPE